MQKNNFLKNIFFGFENPVHANLFTDDDDSSKIEDTIDKDEGRIIRENYCKNDKL